MEAEKIVVGIFMKWFYIYIYEYIFFFSWRDSPLVDLGLLLIHEELYGF